MIIDTGAPAQPEITDLLPDWFMDQMPAGMAPEKLAHEFAYHMIWQMQQPKTLPTVRKHMLAHWRFLQLLADMDGDLFDEVIAAYGERASTFEIHGKPAGIGSARDSAITKSF